ncbi:DUF6225 family protein [Streptomyces rochei]|uniref:DUF6225 family protein n=1 Tax=Streptomyces rochei TaxID=1928 RepID=UPI0037997C03
MTENPEAKDIQPLTVGQLRQALAAYDDDTPLRVNVPDEERPMEVADDRYVVTEAGVNKGTWNGREWVTDPYVTLDVYPAPLGKRP